MQGKNGHPASGKNKMGTMPVPRLLLSMAIPLMLSLLVQSLYNIVDSIYVSGIGQDALTATSLAYPVQILMIALGVGTAVGINALLSRLLGQGRQDEVRNAAATGLVLALLSSLVFVLVGGCFADGIAAMMTDSAEIAALCAEYLRIVTLFSLGSFVETMVQRFLQASGRTGLSMVSLIVGAVTNIILDPIMIYGRLGCPAMGIRGAAVATVIGQWLGALTAVVLNVLRNPEVPISFRGFRLRVDTVKAIYRVGLPTIVMQAMGSVMNFGVNAILADATATAFFGVYYKLQNFVVMPVNGLAQACLPIIGFNYGAGNGGRIRQTIRTALTWGIALGAVCTALFLLLPGPLLSLFNAGEALLAIGIPATRIMCCTFIPLAVTTVLGMSASGLGNGVINMLGSALRQVIVLLPCFALLKATAGLGTAWFALWISELVAVLAVIRMTRTELRKKVDLPGA